VRARRARCALTSPGAPAPVGLGRPVVHGRAAPAGSRVPEPLGGALGAGGRGPRSALPARRCRTARRGLVVGGSGSSGVSSGAVGGRGRPVGSGPEPVGPESLGGEQVRQLLDPGGARRRQRHGRSRRRCRAPGMSGRSARAPGQRPGVGGAEVGRQEAERPVGRTGRARRRSRALGPVLRRLQPGDPGRGAPCPRGRPAAERADDCPALGGSGKVDCDVLGPRASICTWPADEEGMTHVP